MAVPQPRPSTLPEAGALIAGKYRVERELGRGGMGVVYAATHEALRQRVAIKVVPPEGLQHHGAFERFEREARAAAALRSPHVVRVVDLGQLETGAPYLVMEHLEGADLEQVLERRVRLPAHEAADLVLQALDALQEAHGRGIIHRDLKPANLFLAKTPTGASIVKVLDFGLSKMREEGSATASLTGAHLIAGSPHYMSPEQADSLKNTDARTDIWALGVVLFELVTGQRPFKDGSPMAVMLAVMTQPIASPTALCPDVPRGLSAVILRCLERGLDKRIASASELAAVLAPFAAAPGKAPSTDVPDPRSSSSATTQPRPRAPRGSQPDEAFASMDTRPAGAAPVAAQGISPQFPAPTLLSRGSPRPGRSRAAPFVAIGMFVVAGIVTWAIARAFRADPTVAGGAPTQETATAAATTPSATAPLLTATTTSFASASASSALPSASPEPAPIPSVSATESAKTPTRTAVGGPKGTGKISPPVTTYK